MDRQLYLFNPENDLALAADSRNYTPPAAALRLGSDCAALPLWYAGPCDLVAATDIDNRWLDRVTGEFPVEARIYSPGQPVTGCAPWGWSVYARRRFIEMGVDAAALPDDETLARYRLLSHRRITVEMHRLLSETLPYPLPPCPVETDSPEVAERMISNSGRLFLKSPWSSSGRGVLDTTTEPIHQLMRQCRGVIRRQGSIMIEQGLERVQDFAMLFESRGGNVMFTGFSMFFNDSHDAYTGNLLATDDYIFNELSKFVLPTELEATVEATGAALQAVLGNQYDGPVGVDMMVYRDGDRNLIAPCIEVNLRRTMGMVAHCWSKRYLSPDSRGTMTIERADTSAIDSNAVVRGGRLVSGRVSLTPPSALTFRVTVEADRS